MARRSEIEFDRKTGKVTIQSRNHDSHCRYRDRRKCKKERPSFLEMVEDRLNGLSVHPAVPSPFPTAGKKKVVDTQAARFDLVIDHRGGLFHDTLSSNPLRYEVNPSSVSGQMSPRWIGQLLLKDLFRNYADFRVSLAVIVPVGEPTGGEPLLQKFEYRLKFVDGSLYVGDGFMEFSGLENRKVISFFQVRKGKVV